MAVYRDFPEWGIKKHPFIEKNEILRESKFYSWWPGTHNYLALLVIAGGIPAFLYHFNRVDLVTKATHKRNSTSAEKDYA